MRNIVSKKGDLDSKSGADATEYVSKMLKWEDKMLDEPIEKIKKIISGPSYNKFVFVEHSFFIPDKYGQLRKNNSIINLLM